MSSSNELPLAIAGMADPIVYILGSTPETMTDAQLKDLVEKTREFGSSPQAIKAALGESTGVAKKKKLALSADAIALAEQAGF